MVDSNDKDENKEKKKILKFAKQPTINEKMQKSAASIESFHLLDFFKTIFIVSLPHLALLIIFFIYLLTGASIIQEIDIKNRNFKQKESPIHHTTNEVDKIIYYNKFNDFLNIYENKMLEKLNLTNNYDDIDIDGENEKAFRFLKKFVKYQKKDVFNETDENPEEDSSLAYSKRLIKTFLEYKQDMQLNMNKYVFKLLKQEIDVLKNEFKLKLENIKDEDEYICEIENTEVDEPAKEDDQKFRNSIYFALSLLTTIGYGDICPVTPIGKIFTSIYSFVGIPLTLILISDIGSIFTKFLKLLYIFSVDLYQIGYFSPIKKFINRMINNLFNYISKSTSNNRRKARKSSDVDVDAEDSENKKSIIHILFDCYEKSDNLFDFPLLILSLLIFIYLSLGVFIYANNPKENITNEGNVVDYYYFNVISLLKIGLGDLTINLKEASNLYLTFFYAYIIIGVSFFSMIVESLKLKIKLILIKTGHNMLFEVLKFANQLGYNIDFQNDVATSSNDNNNTTGDISSSTSITSGGLSFNDNSNNDDVFYPNSNQKIQLTSRKITNLPSKRKSLLKDLNELKLNGYAHSDCLKYDKQTQITTLLCSKYRNDLITTTNRNLVAPIVQVNSTNQLANKTNEFHESSPLLNGNNEKTINIKDEIKITPSNSSPTSHRRRIVVDSTSFTNNEVVMTSSGSKPSTPNSKRRFGNVNISEEDTNFETNNPKSAIPNLTRRLIDNNNQSIEINESKESTRLTNIRNRFNDKN